MSIRNGNDYIYLIWKDPKTRRNFTIGELSKNSNFEFRYGHEIEKAVDCGFQLLTSFPDKEKTYESTNLFPAFSSRLPDRKRRDIDKILSKYSLPSYDEYELLKRSGARLPIDTYEFIDPIFSKDENIEITFYIMGVRHSTACKGEDCSKLPEVTVGDVVVFEEEPTNEYDPFAIKVLTTDGESLGYIPRYYNQSILDRLHDHQSYVCQIIEVSSQKLCEDCIKVKLSMPV